MRAEDKAVRLGHPSYVWRFGQDRRFDLIRRYVSLANARILDVGCGIGAYVEKFAANGARAFGIDVEFDRLLEAQRSNNLEPPISSLQPTDSTLHPPISQSLNLSFYSLAISESLPFPENTFEAVLLHEVIEHVADDAQTIREAHRVVKPGGGVIVFAPNRLYPFETHGAYFGRRYVFGNIPFVGWLPDSVRVQVAPHVRAYRAREIRALFADLDGKIVAHMQIYPGYDKIARRSASIARLLRGVTYFFESTPLRAFGLSHFVVFRKN
jgi:2-polyprenyl-3-methyl-5-hydroxy-6-metoxy-1,4-benzoquinol methylase